MKYSFITPIYNTETKLLEQSILSIKNLTLKEFEIILINDGSTKKVQMTIVKNYRLKTNV